MSRGLGDVYKRQLRGRALELVAGTLSGKGELRLGGSPRYTGSAVLRDARIDGPQGEGLLGWQSLGTEELRLELSPLAAHAGEVVAQAPRARLVIGPQGKLNLLQALGAGEAGTVAAEGAPPLLSVDRLRIAEGILDFARDE